MIEKYFDLPNGQYSTAVTLVDSSGVSYAAGIATASVGTQTSVASSATDSVILSANNSRKGCTIYNDSTSVLYLLLSTGTSTVTTYTVQLPSNGMLSLRVGEYLGVIKGFWSSVNGAARVTEFV